MKYKIIFLLIAIAINTDAFAQEVVIENVKIAEPVIAIPPPQEHLKEIKGIEVVELPEVEAEYIGGMESLQRFISENIQYPQEAITNNIEGKVYLSFILTDKGEVVEIKVERGTDVLLDKEAKRLLSIMPLWKPAEDGGKTVATRMRIPINFTLNSKQSEN